MKKHYFDAFDFGMKNTLKNNHNHTSKQAKQMLAKLNREFISFVARFGEGIF
jgi:hypothetical protein